MAGESALLFETPEEIFARVFRELKPQTAAPGITIDFRPFANPGANARMRDGEIRVRISDVLEGAPAPILEALAQILLAKLFRRPVPAKYSHRYRLYLNRRDIRQRTHLVRQIRGHKFVSGPEGKHHDLTKVFEELNSAYFNGLMARPLLGWSRTASRTRLGHYDPSHNAIIISRIFDRPSVPRLALEYVMFHEILHLQFPVEAHGSRRRVHTREFQQAEKGFPRLKEAKELLKDLGTLE